MSIKREKLIAHYMFNDQNNIGFDNSGKGNDAIPMGTKPPFITEAAGRKAVRLTGGPSGTSYFELPEGIISEISDDDGLTISAWVYLDKRGGMWERIIDLGSEPGKTNFFLTKNLRGVCVEGEDLAADPVRMLPMYEWVHIAMTVTGSQGGKAGKAGPCIFINGDRVAKGLISQTTSGKYAKLRKWFAAFEDVSNFPKRYIGKSLFEVDANFAGVLSDFRIYSTPLSQDDIIELMCASLSDKDIVDLALNKYLTFPNAIITKDVELQTSLLGHRVSVDWESSDESILSHTGILNKDLNAAKPLILKATLKRGDEVISKSKAFSVVPESISPYTLVVKGDKKVVDVSSTLWGLFYEDINNAADGGIYAELIQNRSFENFKFENYDHSSGENGITAGRIYDPLYAWFGDVEKMTVKTEGGLNDVNIHYVSVAAGATIINRGFCDKNMFCSMNIIKGDKYDFTIWAKSEKSSTITLELFDADANPVSDKVTFTVDGSSWKKYGVSEKITLTGTNTALSELHITFSEDTDIDMVSMFPENVWGSTVESTSPTAHENYSGNTNYRLRKDLVEALINLHPTFLRFPGGCISEGSYIWENVYDWKDSVDDVELRKENYNVWGYVMTMGLGYMEYFQLAEDLGATPLPVMACGVLCQARSDYANPAGGALQEKYIKNFTDLIDFAINTDFENNKWAALRKKMGHEQPFDLHYLGVGNENWGSEFMASFEIFYEAITSYVKKNYPGYDLTILSTVGAQADDEAYYSGWKFLSGNMTGSEKVAFSDGHTSHEEEVTWYKHQPDFMETIADEHYYRSNNYLLNNADRYNYYKRVFNEDMTIDDSKSSKVFVGEYASNEKNTLAGAVAEAAIMTSFENNSDVVRLAATAPLFNKVLTDNQYRWTPDCIWFDNETVWYTPTYYVQQLFAKYIGKKVLATEFKTYENGLAYDLVPRGGIEIAAAGADILVKSIKVVSNIDSSTLLDADLTKGMPTGFSKLNTDKNSGTIEFTKDGLLIKAADASALTGIYMIDKLWTNYKVLVEATKLSGTNGLYVGVGVTSVDSETKNAIEYVIGQNGSTTGVKVYKKGVEGYRLGDFSSSEFAGNLRASINDDFIVNTPYTITVDHGTATGKNLICSYTDGKTTSTEINYKLEAYNDYVFNSVTEDEHSIYMKLVNADEYTKSTDVILENTQVKESAKMVTITAESEHAHTNNINTRTDEYVTPKESTLIFKGQKATIKLPANSVTCIIFDK